MEHFEPITDTSKQPVEVNGKTYIPVKTVSPTKDTSSAIIPKNDGIIDTFKIANTTYIPTTAVPKVFRPYFVNKTLPTS